MIKNVIVFGDSFMYGHETNHRQFVNNEFKKKFKEKVGCEFDRLDFDHQRSGQIKYLTPEQVSLWFSFLTSLDENQKDNCNYNSIGNLLANKLNVPVMNHAVCGSSNNFTFYKVIEHLDQIKKNTLVICGLTEPNRTSKYENRYQPELKHITNMNWFLQSHKDKEKYDLLNLEFGNDHTALVIQTFSYIRAIINLVESKQAKVVFVDPFHTWVSDIFHSGNSFDFVKDFLDNEAGYQHHHVLNIIDSFNHDGVFSPGIANVFSILEQKKLYKYCPGGHYSRELYSEYVDNQLIPFLEEKNVLS